MVITKNKKAYWEYTILDEYVSGIVLVGSELKPLINNKVSLNESYCIIAVSYTHLTLPTKRIV